MSSATKEFNFSLKVMINKEKTRVLFAEADSDFADVLLSFLTLPLGTIVRLLKGHYGDKAPIFGSLNTLYNSVANLDISHFGTEAGRLMLLNPKSSFEVECRKLKLNFDDTEVNKFFACRYWTCNPSILSMYYATGKCANCGTEMNREVDYQLTESAPADSCDGVFTIRGTSFLITDDLRIVPNVEGSVIRTLSNLDINDVSGARQTTVTLGFNKIMDLLQWSLFSRSPLTDLILHQGKPTHSFPASVKLEPGRPLHKIKKEKSSSNSEKKMSLKVMIKKSTRTFLFAEAEEDLVDFLFSFLTIPLGSVQCLLGANSSYLRNMANLYRSTPNLKRFLKCDSIETRLLHPKLPPKYLSKYQLFPLSEPTSLAPYASDYIQLADKSSYRNGSSTIYVEDPKGPGTYLTGNGMYMVTDDLIVKPLRMMSTLSILNGLNIPLSDVEELVLEIGLEEGLGVLRASLTSDCALTNGLNLDLNKLPKHQRSGIMSQISKMYLSIAFLISLLWQRFFHKWGMKRT